MVIQLWWLYSRKRTFWTGFLFPINGWVYRNYKKKDSKVQSENSQTIEKYNKESYATQSKIGQNALIQSKVSEQAENT